MLDRLKHLNASIALRMSRLRGVEHLNCLYQLPKIHLVEQLNTCGHDNYMEQIMHH